MKKISVILVLVILSTGVAKAQKPRIGKLIIDPKISGFADLPIMGGDVVRRDTLKEQPPNPRYIESYSDILKKPHQPSGALVKGKIPDPYCGWAVAVTHNREEFERALPEYRRLIAEGKWREAKEVLHVSTQINVSTKVELFRDSDKLGELPEKVGTFFFSLGTDEFEKYGGYLTFLSFTRDPEYPMIGIGKDIGETIHGMVQVEKVAGKGNFEFSFGGKAILAEITEE